MSGFLADSPHLVTVDELTLTVQPGLAKHGLNASLTAVETPRDFEVNGSVPAWTKAYHIEVAEENRGTTMSVPLDFQAEFAIETSSTFSITDHCIFLRSNIPDSPVFYWGVEDYILTQRHSHLTISFNTNLTGTYQLVKCPFKEWDDHVPVRGVPPGAKQISDVDVAATVDSFPLRHSGSATVDRNSPQ